MRERRSPLRQWLVILLLISWGCASVDTGPPILLYEGPPRPMGEISVIEVEGAGEGHASIYVVEITRVGATSEVIFQSRDQTAWEIPSHFGGPPGSRPGGGGASSGSAPGSFVVLPGSYQIDFRYAPAVDRWGWKHINSEENTTWVDCRPGFTYILEGKLREGNAGWILSTAEIASKTRGAP